MDPESEKKRKSSQQSKTYFHQQLKHIFLSKKKYFAKLLHETFFFFDKTAFFFTKNTHELAHSKFIAIFLINLHIFSQVSPSICFTHGVLKISRQATVWRMLKYDYYILKYTKRKSRIKIICNFTNILERTFFFEHVYIQISVSLSFCKMDIPIYPKSASTETPLSWSWPNVFWFQSEFSGWP